MAQKVPYFIGFTALVIGSFALYSLNNHPFPQKVPLVLLSCFSFALVCLAFMQGFRPSLPYSRAAMVVTAGVVTFLQITQVVYGWMPPTETGVMHRWAIPWTVLFLLLLVQMIWFLQLITSEPSGVEKERRG